MKFLKLRMADDKEAKATALRAQADAKRLGLPAFIYAKGCFVMCVAETEKTFDVLFAEDGIETA